MKKTLLTVGIAALLIGCSTVGRKIEQGNVDQIKQGQTTREEVLKLLGSPDQLGKDGNGKVIMTYTYLRATTKASTFIPIAGAFMGGANVQNQSVVVTLTNNVVAEIVSTSGSTETGVLGSSGSRPKLQEVEQGKREK